LWDNGNVKIIAANIDNANHPPHFNVNNNGDIVWFQYNEAKSKLQIYLYRNGIIENVSNNNLDNFFPQINNTGLIVWSEYDGTNYNIALYDHGDISIIHRNSPGIHEGLQINDNGHIAWLEPIYGSSDREVYFYVDEEIKNISTDVSGYLHLNEMDQLVFLGKNQRTIYLYNNNILNPIVNDQYQKSGLLLNDVVVIVWSQLAEGAISNDIFVYDNGTVRQIERPGEDNSPSINNNNQIVWRGREDPILQYNIFLNDKGSTTQITNDCLQKMSPQINDQGRIVWQGGEGQNSEIYLATPIADLAPVYDLLFN